MKSADIRNKNMAGACAAQDANSGRAGKKRKAETFLFLRDSPIPWDDSIFWSWESDAPDN